MRRALLDFVTLRALLYVEEPAFVSTPVPALLARFLLERPRLSHVEQVHGLNLLVLERRDGQRDADGRPLADLTRQGERPTMLLHNALTDR